MTDEADRRLAHDPQDLERMLIARQWAGDVDGMVALYEPDAVLDSGETPLIPAALTFKRCGPMFSYRLM